MKFAIVSAIWQREALCRIFLNSVERYWKDYGIPTMIAGSEGIKTREMCLDAGAGYIETPNQPLGNKFNKALYAAYINYDPDGFMMLGSDDFVNDKLIKRYIALINEGYDVVGFKDCYFYNPKTSQAVYWPGYDVPHRKDESIGMGRLLSKKVFMRLGGKFWNSSATAGLDWLMTQRLKKNKDFKKKLLTVKDGYVLVDIKGFGNFNSIEQYKTEPIDEKILDFPEFQGIKSL